MTLAHLKWRKRRKKQKGRKFHAWWVDWIKFADALEKNITKERKKLWKFPLPPTHVCESRMRKGKFNGWKLLEIAFTFNFPTRRKHIHSGKNERRENCGKISLWERLFFYFSLNNAEIIELMLIIILSMSQNLSFHCHQHHFIEIQHQMVLFLSYSRYSLASYSFVFLGMVFWWKQWDEERKRKFKWKNCVVCDIFISVRLKIVFPHFFSFFSLFFIQFFSSGRKKVLFLFFLQKNSYFCIIIFFMKRDFHQWKFKLRITYSL